METVIAAIAIVFFAAGILALLAICALPVLALLVTCWPMILGVYLALVLSDAGAILVIPCLIGGLIGNFKWLHWLATAEIR